MMALMRASGMETFKEKGLELAASSASSILVKAHSQKERASLEKRLVDLEMKFGVQPGEQWSPNSEEFKEGLVLLTTREIER